MERNIYLKTVTLEEALALFASKTEENFRLKTEEIPVTGAYGRITSEPVYAKCSNPNYNASAMDGIMVPSHLTISADERRPLQLKKGRDFKFVDTGDVIEAPYDSVIMIEDVQVIDEETVEILAPSYPWMNVRMVGEDFVIGEMLLTRHHLVKAVDLGALISGGIETLQVLKKLRVGLIPTGSEIVDIGTTLKPGDILESNTRMFAGLVLENGGEPHRYPIVPDEKEKLRQALIKATSENDIVIINAGSSAGSEDYTASLIAELGEVWVHGIDIKPGKPAILGAIGGKPVVGIPGYPVSAYMTFKHFVVPMLTRTPATTKMQEALLSQAVPSSLKHKEFVRVQLGRVNDKIIATPLKRGAASTMSLVKANGILTIDKASEGYPAGTMVSVEMTRNHLDLNDGLVAIGSHDLIMDWISDIMMTEKYRTYVLSAHTGSLGGIMAIKRGEAHLAPIHLLDEATGTYNLTEINRYLKGQEMVLIKGIKRWQGFYTRMEDQPCVDFSQIVRGKLQFVNRQKGSGTRLLTDYFLKKEGVVPSEVEGYQTEVLTHTAVALAVKTGNADVGIGIASVAHHMALNYHPLAKEDYDFLVPLSQFDLPVVQDFIKVLRSEAFKSKLDAAGGYELEELTFINIGG